MTSIVNGTSTVYLVAASQQLLDNAITFYTNTLGLTEHSKTEDTTFLSNDGNKAIIEIRLDTKEGLSESEIQSRRSDIESKLNVVDWRSLDNTSVIKVANLVDLIEVLTSSKFVLQITPNELYPNEVYIVDPLGYIIDLQLVTIL